MISSHGRVLVTGATGLVGGHLVRSLHRSGVPVRAVLRETSAEPAPYESVVVGDMAVFHDWPRVLHGVTAVVQAAGRAHIPARAQEIERDRFHLTNVAATLSLAKAAAAAGVKHFIFLSSIAVNGSNSAGRAPFSESDEASPKTVYGRSKAEAEKQLETLAEATRMAVTAVRPPMIYGWPWRGSFDTLVRAIQRGVPLPLGSIKNKRAFISVDNVVSFVRHRLESDAGSFDAFIVADDEQVSTPEFIRRVGKAMAKGPRVVACPPAIISAAAKLAGRGDLTDSLFGSLQVDTSKSRSTGWRPELTMDEGLARALR